MRSLVDVGNDGFDIELFKAISYGTKGIFRFKLLGREGKTENRRLPCYPE